MENVAYAVHTKTCTFLLDREGLCHWIVSRHGMVPPEIRGCVGAQFVASLHAELDGLLAGELLIGSAALFVKHDSETDKLVLLRTGTILHIEDREAGRTSQPPRPLGDDTLDLGGDAASVAVRTQPLTGPPQDATLPLTDASLLRSPVGGRGGDTVPPPAYVVHRPRGASLADEAEELDVQPDPDSLPDVGPLPPFQPREGAPAGHGAARHRKVEGESTITLTLPLFRGGPARRLPDR